VDTQLSYNITQETPHNTGPLHNLKLLMTHSSAQLSPLPKLLLEGGHWVETWPSLAWELHVEWWGDRSPLLIALVTDN
jgi:hypothetical protein